jgi:ribosomal protein S1
MLADAVALVQGMAGKIQEYVKGGLQVLKKKLQNFARESRIYKSKVDAL